MRLMIVDDERLTRESLSSLLPYREMGVDEVVAYANGRDAYQAALSAMPDILLCDVRMPKMDGLQLSKLLRMENSALKIIFISGYADKEYLKTAIMVQALGYVEKPIDVAELTALLKSAIRLVKEDRHTARSPAVDSILRQRLMEALTGGHWDRSSVDDGFFNWPETGSYYCACLHILWFDPQDVQQIERVDKEMLQAAADAFHTDEDAFQAMAGLMSPRRICILYNGSASEAANSREYFCKRLRALHENWKRVYADRLHCAIGYSLSAQSLGDIAKEYRQATAMARWQVFLERDEMICVADARKHETDPREEYLRQWKALMNAEDPIGARALLQAIDRSLRGNSLVDIEAVRKLFEQMLQIMIATRAESLGQKESEYIRIGVLSAFGKQRTLRDLIAFLEMQLDECFPELAAPKGISLKVAQILRYISAHLAEPDLSIQRLAEAMSLTETYLCALYKKETGSTVNKSITDARIERAKRLLLQDYKLYEVADKVGFVDPNYFSTVFKKQTGISPTNYRRTRMGKEAADDGEV